MTTITAEQVRRLSARTKAAMADCRRALEECDGDEEKAARWCRYKGIAVSSEHFWRLVNHGPPVEKKPC